MTLKILHNPRCSKSRATLALLQEQGLEPTIIDYLKSPPSAGELVDILRMLDLEPRALLRKGEAQYKELGLADEHFSDAELIEAMVKHPKLIERPIVLANGKAALGRPPENVLVII